MEGLMKVAFKMNGPKREVTIFTNIPIGEVKVGMDIVLKRGNIENSDKRQIATIQKLLFEEKTGFFKSVIKEQVILSVSEEGGTLSNTANEYYKSYCAMVKVIKKEEEEKKN